MGIRILVSGLFWVGFVERALEIFLDASAYVIIRLLKARRQGLWLLLNKISVVRFRCSPTPHKWRTITAQLLSNYLIILLSDR